MHYIRFYAAAEKEGLLPDEQFGSRKGMGVLEAIFMAGRLREDTRLFFGKPFF